MKKCPEGLNKESRRLWLDVSKGWKLDTDSIEILRVACFSLHNFLEAKKVLDKEGAYFTTTTGQKKKHPLWEIMKNERTGFLQAMKQLNLSDGTDEAKREPGRPAGDRTAAWWQKYRMQSRNAG